MFLSKLSSRKKFQSWKNEGFNDMGLEKRKEWLSSILKEDPNPIFLIDYHGKRRVAIFSRFTSSGRIFECMDEKGNIYSQISLSPSSPLENMELVNKKILKKIIGAITKTNKEITNVELLVAARVIIKEVVLNLR